MIHDYMTAMPNNVLAEAHAWYVLNLSAWLYYIKFLAVEAKYYQYILGAFYSLKMML